MKMNRITVVAISLVMAFGLFAFTAFKNGSIRGSVSPSAAATSAYVVSGMDTMRTNIKNGAFEIDQVKPGTYKLVIEAVAPYKNFEKEGVVVNEKKTTDVGEITMQQ
jgi:polysaccharide lyase family 4-like protein